MSRRRASNTDHVYGAVRLMCPDGHPLGLAIKPDPQLDRYTITAGLERVNAPDGRTKIKARCASCEAAGRHRDLQASWEGKVLPLLQALQGDPSSGVLDVRIGG